MSEHDRGAYAPPTEASLSFDARQPVRGSRPIPFTLIISILVLLGLAAAIFVFYSSGVRQAGQPPQAVGTPVAGIKTPPPAEAQPQDPAAGLQIYQGESGRAGAANGSVQFAPPPEQPQPRPQPGPATPPIVVTQAPPAAPAPALRPSIPAAAPPVAVTPAPKAAAPAVKAAPPPAAKVEKPAPKPAPPPAAKVAGVAAVQIGAFSSQALADKGWNNAAALAPGMAAGKGKSVEKIEKDGHTLFRTQVTGFASRDAASAFCAKLKAAGKACFVK